MRVSVAFTPSEAAAAPVAVAVDVIRATSTICAALAAGFDTVACTAGIDEARALGARGARLAGERGCVRIDGFDFGNSPAELEAAGEAAGTLALTTTNGTRLLVAAAERCDRVYVGSLANLAAVVRAVLAQEPAEVALLCAGADGAFALDDAYCAGRFAQALGGDQADSAVAAAILAAALSAQDALERSASAENLRAVGLEADIAWCARESVLDVVPVVTRREPDAVLVVPEAATLARPRGRSSAG